LTALGVILMPFSPSACDAWGVGRVDASFSKPVTNDVPVLILAGEWDPNTPPWGGATRATDADEQLLHSIPRRHARDGFSFVGELRMADSRRDSLMTLQG
jgi:hypothetical protein